MSDQTEHTTEAPTQTTHGDAKQRAAGEELAVGLAEAGAEFECDKEQVVDDKRPAAPPPVGCDAEDDGARRPQHQDGRDAPGYLRRRLVERRRQVLNHQRHRKEVQRVPCPGPEGAGELQPL